MRKYLLALLIAVFACSLTSCRSTKEAVAMKDCSYKFKSISDIRFMGIGKDHSVLSPLTVAKITSALTGVAPSIPLDFTINLNVSNPNSRRAAVEGLNYIVRVDDVVFAEGMTTQNFSVEGGETAILPLPINVDLKSIVNSEHRSVIGALVLNMMGLNLGGDKSKIKVQIKPTIKIGKSILASPVYVPLVVEYGGE